MTPQRHAQVRALFLEATALPESQRNGFLSERCGKDLELREEVLKLLSHHVDDTLAYPIPVAVQVVTDSELDSFAFSAGDKIADRYRIVTLLGRGGMGSVYRADDLTLKQPIALKLLDPRYAKRTDWIERFRNEVRLARRVTHPNVCRVFDIGESDGRVFLTMEYVDGEDLAGLIRRIGRLSIEKATDVARQVCTGLAAAHSAGVLHRDLKPANILMDRQGRVRLTDFGIAVDAGTRTAGARRAGTPAYMAPEQFTGRGMDVRGDIYALGLVLYELYGGEQAFRADSYDDYARLHEHEEPRRLSEVVPDIDPEVDTLVHRCLAKDKADRPPTALSVAAALPGVDVLAVALSANQTPPPSLVAGAATIAFRVLRPGRWACLAMALLFLLPWVRSVAGLPWDRSGAKPTLVLAEKARELLYSTGQQETASTMGYGTLAESTELLALFNIPEELRRRFAAADGQLVFWFRTGDRPLIPRFAETLMFGNGRASLLDPPPIAVKQQVLLLEPTGRFRAFFQIGADDRIGEPEIRRLVLHQAAGGSPAPAERSGVSVPEPLEWSQCGTRPVTFSEGGQDVELHVCGSGNKLAIVRTAATEAPSPGAWMTHFERVRIVSGALRFFFMLIAFLSIPVAWNNVALGRADVGGALKTGCFVFGVHLAAWTMGANHAPVASIELAQLSMAFFRSFGAGALVVVLYMGLEPFARRKWPHLLIGWTRLLRFRRRDGVVWEHVLVGVALGVFWALLASSEWALIEAMGWSGGEPYLLGRAADLLLGGGVALAGVLQTVAAALAEVLLFAAMHAFARSVVRRPNYAALMVAVALIPIVLPRCAHPATSWLTGGIGVIALGVWVMMHVGLLAVAVAAAVAGSLNATPLPLTSGPPWNAQSLILFAVLIATILVAWRVARNTGGDRPATY